MLGTGDIMLVKNAPAVKRDTRDMGLIPRSGQMRSQKTNGKPFQRHLFRTWKLIDSCFCQNYAYSNMVDMEEGR